MAPMDLYVVLESIGGWSGTPTEEYISRAFTTPEAALHYIRVMDKEHRQELWSGEMFKVMLDYEDVNGL